MKPEESGQESAGYSGPANPNVILSADSYRRYAEQHGFRQELLEKVIRLGQIMVEIANDDDLAPKLALKGGTAINLLMSPVRRLSVDLDFNYVGAVERQAMLADKPVVLECFTKLAGRHEYRADVPRDEHGGSKFSLRYRNSLGNQDQIEIDVN